MHRNFEQQIRDSVKRDFDSAFYKKIRERGNKTNQAEIISIPDDSLYFKYRRFLVGKLIRILREGMSGQWIEFVNEEDAIALNKAAGWTNKREYLLNAKYKTL